MKRSFHPLLVASLLLAGAALAPAHADGPVGEHESDMGNKIWQLQRNDAPVIVRLKAEIARLSFQIERLNAQRQSAKSPRERAALDQRTAQLGRLLAHDNLSLLVLETDQQRLDEIRAGVPFPGVRLVPL